jgi:hypothetical protein
MANITKTQGTAILAHTAITHPDSVFGSAQDVATKLAATIVMFHASVEATGNTNPGSFYVQVSGASSNDEDWVTVAKYTAQATTADTEALSGSEAAGQTALEVASTTGFAAGDILYIQDTGVVADGEWNYCDKIVANTSIDLWAGLTNAKDNADVVWNDAEIFVCQLDLTAVGRVRVVFQHEGATGANVHVKALMVTGDSIG